MYLVVHDRCRLLESLERHDDVVHVARALEISANLRRLAVGHRHERQHRLARAEDEHCRGERRRAARVRDQPADDGAELFDLGGDVAQPVRRPVADDRHRCTLDHRPARFGRKCRLRDTQEDAGSDKGAFQTTTHICSAPYRRRRSLDV